VLLPRNVPGFQTGGYIGSHSYDAPQANGTTYPTYEGPYPQLPMLPRVQPGMPMGYDTSHWQASQQPPIGPSPRSEYDPSWSVPPANFPLPPGVVHQQGPGPMGASWPPSQDSAAHNALGGSYSPRSANESYFPYNSGGFVGQQNPPSMTPPRSQLQGSAGDWNAMAGSSRYSHSGQSASGSYSPPPPAGFCHQNLQPMTAASPHQGPAGVQDALRPHPYVYLDCAIFVPISFGRQQDWSYHDR
jgi:hypothetical protein